ncbi:acyl-CoA dehydrogenase [Prauserella sediminis]|uniref:Acyl-CoA dehydrogenase n=1 Tax=Prauserella sediminis TaxID=577680 RepID=A0A839XP77_9PSEU|nr:acyl-CoA dehydrogenase family protein [Prauserella sediminis]MBB3664551.1 acyl-CoA dehydrogenase [Prauserella sediminis]
MTTDPITADPDLRKVLRDILDGDLHGRLDQSTTGVTLDVALWEQLSELGFTAFTAPEAHGGAGAGWLEAAALLGESAAAARHLPLAESDLLAHWLLREVGLPPADPMTARTVAIVEPNGTAVGVPWLGRLPVVIAARRQDGTLAVAELTADELADHAMMTAVPTLSGQPLGDLTFTTDVPEATVLDAGTGGTLLDQLALRGALARAVQIAASLDKAVDLCVEHASVRAQFGRPLAKFQAVQQLVADAAAEAALARAAVDAAVLDAAATDLIGPASATLVAAARSCAGHATSVVVRNAHQVHGAIGTTQEHPLQLFTQAALDWRGEFGTTRSWDRFLGEAVRTGPAALWNAVVGAPIPDATAVLPGIGRRR